MRQLWICVGISLGFCHAAQAADAARGQSLYEVRCTACHKAVLHTRASAKVRNYEQLQAEVKHWEAAGKERWSAEELADVVQYLNDRFYRFDCPKSC